MRRHFFAIALAALLALAPLAACSGGDGGSGGGGTPEIEPPVTIPLDTAHGIADQTNLYGMCYIMESRLYYDSTFTNESIPKEIELMKNLGVKTVRHWMHCTRMMTDKDTMNEVECERAHIALRECRRYGIVNIGMNHHNFNGGISSIGKLRRSLVKGGEYIRWLEDFYTTWYNLVKEFPEVQYWEIDNELNNPDFMFNAHDRSFFTGEEMAAIATDMLYYGSLAVHAANPEAQVIMGGLTEPMGLGLSDLEKSKPSNVWFLEKVYENIESGEYGYRYGAETNEEASLDPDDYFEILGLHPYWWKTALEEQYFIDENNKVYEVLLRHEKKHKKVFMTEVGTTEFGKGGTGQAELVRVMYHAISSSMPYVETLDYYNLIDVAVDCWGGSSADGGFSRFGLFYDPVNACPMLDEEHPNKRTDVLCVPGAPKPLAYLYQELAGGEGSLTLLQKQAE